MEWRAGRGQNEHSVIVPDELLTAILNLLRGTGVAIDPYRDRTLGNESTQRMAEALRNSWDLHRVGAEDEVKQELGVWTLPAWAEKLVAARMEQDRLMTTCAALIALCEYALAQDVDIEILGQ